MYIIVLAEIILVWILYKLFRKFILSIFKRFASRTPSEADDAIVASAEKFIIPFLDF